MLSQRLDLKVQLKQTLTPGLVQMVTVLQMNRLELKDMITREVAQNPVLDEGAESGEELTPAEVQAALEAERAPNPSDEGFLEASRSTAATAGVETGGTDPEPRSSDPFEEIDFGQYFEDYLDPGHKSPAQENPEKPSFETFLSSPVTLSSHLQSQLSLVLMTDEVRDAAETIIGNLEEDGYLREPLEDIAAQGGHRIEDVEKALHAVQSLDPAGVGARNLQECMLLQIVSNGGENGVAWQIVTNHLKLLENKQYKELARALGRPLDHIDIAVQVIHRLDPKPGLRYSGQGARQIEPDVYFVKDGDRYLIQLNDDDIPQLRLNGQYRRMLDRDKEPSKDVRDYVKERFSSALLLIKNIEQRRRTIIQVCDRVIEHQREFLDSGIEHLRPMMIKDIAGEIGVHPSTVSRAVSNKYAHTPQGVLELRTFFSEAVQGPAGGGLSLLVLKRKVKKMIDDEDARRPLTDDQITALLKGEGIVVTRRTVAKYREDMKIPSTHQRRRKE
jgi:RNA polymerase sigma-54 factor